MKKLTKNKNDKKIEKLNKELKKIKDDGKKNKERFSLRKDIKNFFEALNSFFYKNAKTKNSSTEDTVFPQKNYKNGVFKISKNEYSKTLEFFDRNYTSLSDEDREEVFMKFSEMISSFDSLNSYQFSYVNLGEKSFKLENRFKIENKNDDFDIFRDEYNLILKHKINKNKGFEKRKFLTFTTKAKNIKEADSNLLVIEKELKKEFKKLGAETKVLELNERLELLYEMLNPYKNDFKSLEQKEDFAPKLIDFSKVDEFKINEMFGKSFAFEIVGTEISDEILKEFIKTNENIFINFHIEPIEQIDGQKSVARTLTNLQMTQIEEQKKAIKNGYDMDLIGGKLKENIKNVESLLDDVKSKNEKLFKVTCIFTIIGKDKMNVKKTLATLKKKAKKENSILKPLKYLQEQALVSSLPLGKNEIENRRILTTSSTAAFIPFETKELITKGTPFYYGNNQLSKNIICLDRMSLNSANGLILGSTGSGKSFAAKQEITLSYLLTNDEILILDPEKEYIDLTKALGGEVIKISPNSKNYINPLDINLGYGGDEDSALSAKMDFVLSFFELILKRSLLPREDSMIDRALRRIYKKYFENPIDKNIPILEDLYNELLTYGTEASEELCESLEFYVKGSMSVFNHRTNINIKNRIICYDINSLGEKLRKIGMQIIQNEVWNRVTINRNRKVLTRYYVDEAHLFFEDPITAKFNTQVYKRFRKYGGVPTLMTQNVKNILAYKGVEDIFENTDFILILKQAPKDRELMSTLLNLSEKEEEYITDNLEGSGLIKFGKDIVPLENEFPKKTKLYGLLQTTFRET